jgi:hypothetical protein
MMTRIFLVCQKMNFLKTPLEQRIAQRKKIPISCTLAGQSSLESMEPITLATLPAVACIIAVLTQHWAYGFATCLIVHIAWLEIFGTGALYPVNEVYSFYAWAILLFAVGGHVISRIFNWHPLLNGRYLIMIGRDKGVDSAIAERKGWSRFTNVTARMLFGLALLIAAHIPLELQIDRTTWPIYAGGLVTTGAIVLVWIVIWAMLRFEQTAKGGAIFRSDKVETEAQKHESVVNLRNELKSFIFYFALTHAVYVTVYWIVWESVSDAVWLTQSWWFYTSLCVAGGIFIIMSAVGLGLQYAPKRNGYAAVPPPAAANFTLVYNK